MPPAGSAEIYAGFTLARAQFVSNAPRGTSRPDERDEVFRWNAVLMRVEHLVAENVAVAARQRVVGEHGEQAELERIVADRVQPHQVPVGTFDGAIENVGHFGIDVTLEKTIGVTLEPSVRAFEALGFGAMFNPKPFGNHVVCVIHEPTRRAEFCGRQWLERQIVWCRSSRHDATVVYATLLTWAEIYFR